MMWIFFSANTDNDLPLATDGRQKKLNFLLFKKFQTCGLCTPEGT